jgi:hypothetical protein
MTAPQVFSFASMMVRAQRRHAERMAAQAAAVPQQRREIVLRSTVQEWSSIFQRFTLSKGKHV